MNYRNDFPQLKTQVQGQPLVYADFASTSLKPQGVIDAISAYYSTHVANPGRGISSLALDNQLAIENVRNQVKNYVNADSSYTVIFTKNATEAINLVAKSLSRNVNEQQFTIHVTEAEHHANFLPWLHLKHEKQANVSVASLVADGTPDLEAIQQLLQTTEIEQKLLAITHCSNVTGNATDLEKTSAICQANGTLLLVDATQSFPHLPIDLRKTPVDFLVASAHKAYGPEGVGVLIVSNRGLQLLKPLLLGGGIVDKVTKESFTLRNDVSAFEAGTPNTAGIVGFGAALNYLQSIGAKVIADAEQAINTRFINLIPTLPEFKFLPISDRHIPIFSLYHPTIHAHDIADFLDKSGIVVRAGFHCAEPLHQALKAPATVRISLSFVNTVEDVDTIFAILKQCLQKFV